jgi:hypothetical protein
MARVKGNSTTNTPQPHLRAPYKCPKRRLHGLQWSTHKFRDFAEKFANTHPISVSGMLKLQRVFEQRMSEVLEQSVKTKLAHMDDDSDEIEEHHIDDAIKKVFGPIENKTTVDDSDATVSD